MTRSNAIAFVAFTERGIRLAQRLAHVPALRPDAESGVEQGEGHDAGAAASSRFPQVSAPKRLVGDGVKGSEGSEDFEGFEGLEGVEGFDFLSTWTAEAFATCGALVFVGATGIAVRAIAPYVNDKFSDPAVVCVDEAGRVAVPLLSGHVGGANRLARAIAQVTGGVAAVSTATDVNGVFAVDEWAHENGLAIVERKLAKEVSARLLEGGPVGFASDFGSAYRVSFQPADTGCDVGIAVSLNDACRPFERTLHLVPRAVTVGVGCRKGASADVLAKRVDDALTSQGVSARAVKALATIDVKRDEPAILHLSEERGWDLRFYSAEELAAVPGDFAGSDFVEQTVGVDNVCERAAVAEGGRLLAHKVAGEGVTVALGVADPDEGVAEPDEDEENPIEGVADPGEGAARRGDGGSGIGRLSVVGLGPGGAADMTERARAALDDADVIVGYGTYVKLVENDYPGKETLVTPMRKEVERCRMALAAAAKGRRVAMVCSGDPGVYGMAGLVLELAGEFPPVDVHIVPGVTAANGGAAVLGAPLMHDWCSISLSDLLTPWELIEKRLVAAAQADFVIALYNPSSHKRADYLQRACDVLLRHKDPATVCGIVRNIGREGQQSRVLTLGELRDVPVDMFTTVFVGNSQTRCVGGTMVTPRGYLQNEKGPKGTVPFGPLGPYPMNGR